MLVKSLDELGIFARDFFNTLEPNKNAVTVVGLIGDLGAGKTAFTQVLARALGVTEPITSPTFVIQKIYNLENQKFKNLVHIDCYRLDSGADLAKLDWVKLTSDPGNLILVEWADKVEKILPPQTRKIFFRFVDETTREITFDEF